MGCQDASQGGEACHRKHLHLRRYFSAATATSRVRELHTGGTHARGRGQRRHSAPSAASTTTATAATATTGAAAAATEKLLRKFLRARVLFLFQEPLRASAFAFANKVR